MTRKLKKGVQKLWEEAMAEVKTISAEEAVALYGGEDVLFVDIRDVRELARDGMIPGAIHAPRGMLEYWVDPDSPYYKTEFTEEKQVVLY